MLRTSPGTATRSANRHERVAEREILLVEDDPMIREIFAQALTRDGYRVTVARDGMQALHQLWKRTPDLIILDLCLPVLPGLDLLRRLGEETDPGKPPVLVVTARAEPEVLARARSYGAVSCLQKPLRLRDLVARVHEVLDDA